MAGIGKNRVFDRTALSELQSQGESLLACATTVTEELTTEMENLISAAAKVPSQAKHEQLGQSAETLKNSLTDPIYENLKKWLTAVLEKLEREIPMYDASYGEVLTQTAQSAESLLGMLEELAGFLGKGGLTMSLTEYRKAIEDYERRFAVQGLLLQGSILLAETYLKGMVYTSSFSCDPVNLSTGNFYYEKEDLSIGGSIPLVFRRFYNALGEKDSILGNGWSTFIDVCLTKNGDEKLVLHGEDGKETTFQKKDGEYTDIYTGRIRITTDGNGYFLKQGNNWQLFFDGKGKLFRKEMMDGRGISIDRERKSGNVISMSTYHICRGKKKKTGDYLAFTYNNQGKLVHLEDHTGRKVTYFYMDGKLQEVTDPMGNTICYRYGENGKLRAVKNACGVQTVRNIYDGQGRIRNQKFPDKGQMHYEYRERETVLTERNGSRTTYIQDEKLRNVRTIYHNSEETNQYDARDLLTAHTDRNGNTTQYEYDENGHLSCITDALGEKKSFAFDEKGRLLKVQVGETQLLTNSYDEKGRLTESSDALGRKKSIVYGELGLAEIIRKTDGSKIELIHDQKGNLTGIRDPYGVVTKYKYDELNRVIQTEDGNGNIMSYEYDGKDRLMKVTNAEGNSRRYEYNKSGKVTRMEDFDGEVMEISYNNLNRPERIRDKEGRETVLHYDKMWNVKEEILPTGAVICYTYDEDNRLAKCEIYENEEKKKKLRSVQYQYDANGNLTEVLSGEGEEIVRVRYSYDALNRRTSYTDGEGNTSYYCYDDKGRLAAVQDAVGNLFRREYNEAGERTAVISPEGLKKRYAYDDAGNLIGITDALGRTTRFTYEPGGRRTGIIYPNGEEERFTYDANGNLLTRCYGKNLLTYTYDAMNRVIEKRSSTGAVQTYVYDAMNRVISRTDSNGNKTEYEYTRSGKVKKVRNALSGESSYTYDDGDALVRIHQSSEEDLQTSDTVYVRNSIGELLAVRDALLNEDHYEYDSLGRVQKKQDRDGFITKFSYYGNGDIQRVIYGDGKEVELFYSPLRKLKEIRDAFGTTKIEQDSAGRTVRVTDPEKQTVEYWYGIHGERLGMRYPNGENTEYTYDDQLRLCTVGAGQGMLPESTFSYNQKGQLTERKMDNGIRTTYLYDEIGRLVRMTHQNVEGIQEDYQYEYDLAGNKCAITRERRGLPEESGRYEYHYDLLNRLTGVSQNGKRLREYGYDAFGNRKYLKNIFTGEETHYEYNAANQLLRETRGETERTYQYDKRGNLTEEWENGILVHTYDYDASNRLSHVVSGDGEEAWYSYNGLGQRVEEIHGEKRTRLLLDMTRPYGNLLEKEEFLPEGENRKQTYLWGGTLLGMTQKNDTGENGAIYLLDELGSPVRLLNENGASEEVYGYDEFGNGWGESSQPFGYTGYRKDETSGTWFAQAREYHPQTGRFLGEDIIKGNEVYPQTLNPYGYCWGNPINLVDFDGKSPWALVPVLIALILGGCSSTEIQPVVEPKVEPIPTPTPTPTPTPSPMPTPVPDTSSLHNYSYEPEFIAVQDYDVETRTELIEFIRYGESGRGFNSKLYDANDDGYLDTIGYGHDVTQNGDIEKYIVGQLPESTNKKENTGLTMEMVEKGEVSLREISEEEAEKLLLDDLKSRIPWKWLEQAEKNGHRFTANEIDALVSLNYTTGLITINASSDFLDTISRDYADGEIYEQFMTYDRGKEGSLSGLAKRHSAEAWIFLRNVYKMDYYDKGEIECIP